MIAATASVVPWWLWLVLGGCLLLILIFEWGADD